VLTTQPHIQSILSFHSQKHCHRIRCVNIMMSLSLTSL